MELKTDSSEHCTAEVIIDVHDGEQDTLTFFTLMEKVMTKLMMVTRLFSMILLQIKSISRKLVHLMLTKSLVKITR